MPLAAEMYGARGRLSLASDCRTRAGSGKAGPSMRTPITITFDPNTYSTIADSKISRLLEK